MKFIAQARLPGRVLSKNTRHSVSSQGHLKATPGIQGTDKQLMPQGYSERTPGTQVSDK